MDSNILPDGKMLEMIASSACMFQITEHYLVSHIQSTESTEWNNTNVNMGSEPKLYTSESDMNFVHFDGAKKSSTAISFEN